MQLFYTSEQLSIIEKLDKIIEMLEKYFTFRQITPELNLKINQIEEMANTSLPPANYS